MKIDAETIKTLFRPLLTLILVSAWLFFIVQGITYPKEFMWLTLACAGEWVGERSLKRLKEILK